MKNLFKVLMIAVLIISFNSCSTDDEDNIVIPQTFLEKYDGTVWLYTSDWVTEYLRIINNETTPFEMWDSFSDDCFNYYLIDLNGLLDQVEVTGNSGDIFELTITYPEMVDTSTIITVRVDGDILIMEANYYEGDELTETSYDNYERQNVDVDGFILCD